MPCFGFSVSRRYLFVGLIYCYDNFAVNKVGFKFVVAEHTFILTNCIYVLRLYVRHLQKKKTLARISIKQQAINIENYVNSLISCLHLSKCFQIVIHWIYQLIKTLLFKRINLNGKRAMGCASESGGIQITFPMSSYEINRGIQASRWGGESQSAGDEVPCESFPTPNTASLGECEKFTRNSGLL